jgi:hypothetical protein
MVAIGVGTEINLSFMKRSSHLLLEVLAELMAVKI